MAKFSKSISFKNCSIDAEKDLITEVLKDETKFYKLSKVIADWQGIEGLNISIKKDDELESEDDTTGEDEEN
jgi:hypothetical protein